jgi:hypothetical protein
MVTWRKSSYSANGGDCVEVGWHTSSYSANGGNCVEVGWHTSSYSANGGSCVEVRTGPQILVRDTKNREGGILTVSAAPWRELLSRLR